MATVGNLFVGLAARPEAFLAGLDRARKGLQRFADSFTPGRVLAYGSAITGVATALAGVYLHAQSESIDKASKLSRALGISTESLIGLEYGADLAGVSAEETAVLVTKLSRTLGEASTGSKTALAAFDAIGLSLGDLAGLPLDAVLGKVADGLAAMESPAARTAAAVDLFGRSGAKAIPWLLEGSAGMAAMQKEAEALGLTVSGSTGLAIEEMNDSLTRVKAALSGVAASILTEAAPYVLTLTEGFIDAAKAGGGFKDKVHDAFSAMIPILSYASDVVGVLGLGFNLLKAAALGLAGAILYLDSAVLTGINNMTLGLTGLGETATALRDSAVDLLSQSGDALNAAGKSFDALASNNAADTFAAGVDRTRARLAELKPAAASAAAAVAEIGDALEETSRSTEKAIGAADALAHKLYDQARTYGMTAREAEIYLATANGATDAQVAYLSRVDQWLTKKEAETEALKKSTEAARDAAAAHDDLIAEGARVMRDVMTPIERYEDELLHLRDLMEEGAISQETFDRAVAKAAQGIAPLEETSTAIADATQGLSTAVGDMKIAGVYFESVGSLGATGSGTAAGTATATAATPAGVTRAAEDSVVSELRTANGFLTKIAANTAAFAGALT